jgi:RNA polymerase sigma-B factor
MAVGEVTSRCPGTGSHVPVGSDVAGRDRRERELFRRLAAGDRRAREELAARFMPLARAIAMRYRRASEPIDDLLQVASMGLLKAIDRYELSRGVAFSSYAVPTIAGELKRYFRDYSWAVRPPRQLHDLVHRVDRVASELTAQLDRAPTTAELSRATGVDEERLLEAIQASSARSALSLQMPVGQDGSSTIEEQIGSDDGGITGAETQAVLDDLLTTLAPREREILRLRFEEDMTQAEIGAIVGVSQMQISRIIRQALARLRDAADRSTVCVADVPNG